MTALLARKRNEKDWVVVMGPDTSPNDQIKKRDDMYNAGSAEFDAVLIADVIPAIGPIPVRNVEQKEKSTMKKTLRAALGVFFALLVVGFTLSAGAQSYRYEPVPLNVTPAITVVGGTASNTPNAVIDVRGQDSVCVQITQTYDGAGTANMGYYFTRSVDGSTYSGATGANYVTVAGTGNTPVTIVTNIPSFGAGFIKLAYVTNASAGSVTATNLSVKWAAKLLP